MEANNHQGIQMELSQESLVKELAESKQREAELRKDNKDLFVAVFRCKATEARVKMLEDAVKAYMFTEQTIGGKNPHKTDSNKWLAFELGRQALAAKETKA